MQALYKATEEKKSAKTDSDMSRAETFIRDRAFTLSKAVDENSRGPGNQIETRKEIVIRQVQAEPDLLIDNSRSSLRPS